MSLQRDIGAPYTWDFHGRKFQVSGLTPYQLGQLNAVLEVAFPSEVQKAKANIRELGDLLGTEDRLKMLEDARERDEPSYDENGIQVSGWPVEFASRKGQAYFFSGKGIADFLRVILGKHNQVSADEAEELAIHLDSKAIEKLMGLIGVRPTEEAPEQTSQSEGYVNPKD